MATKAELAARLAAAVQRMSTATVVFHEAVAAGLGLHVTDHKALGVLRAGPCSAGELMEATGLTSGAVTGLIDRLERAGYVRRTRDPSDARRVVVEAIRSPANERRLARRFGPLSDEFAALAARYTREELALVLEFTEAGTELIRRQSARVRAIDD